jgi:predicted phage tail protein
MTTIRLHGILAQEYSDVFFMKIGKSGSVFSAIDCNHKGFTKRVVELQREGFFYDVIVNKTKTTNPQEIDGVKNPETIDLVPVIVGSGPALLWITGGTFWANVAASIALAGISYALSPKPDTQNQGVEATAQASKGSFVFGGAVNTASQGTHVPIGYGRLKVGSKVVQATIKSFPQNQQTQNVLTSNRLNNTEEELAPLSAVVTSRVSEGS